MSLRHFDEFTDVADHCTVCHKCEAPCPVDIDFGDVSIAMRNLLRDEGRKRFRPATAAAMFFLNATDPTTIKIAKRAMIGWGYSRATARACRARQGARARQEDRRSTRPSTSKRARRRARRRSSISSTSRCPADLPKRTARALLDIEDNTIVPIIRNPRRSAEDSDAVFYFPGCGSERLFSQVGLATQAML